MPRLVAFLRGINVGGHRVKMDTLRRHFGDLGLANVETFIASGNVIFDAPHAAGMPALERRIESHLQHALGYATATYIRSASELAAITAFEPFADIAPDHSLYVVLSRTKPDAAHRRHLAAWCSDVDDFLVHGREIYWRCRGKISEVSKAWPLMEKAKTGGDATSRNMNTLRRLDAVLRGAS